jgi:hypothetical protein
VLEVLLQDLHAFAVDIQQPLRQAQCVHPTVVAPARQQPPLLRFVASCQLLLLLRFLLTLLVLLDTQANAASNVI